MTNYLFLVSVFRPFTSTPHPRKVAKPTREKVDVKIQVFDGLAMRSATIPSSANYVRMLDTIAKSMRRPNESVMLGYEAPWSPKLGTKKVVAYISNDMDVDQFFDEYFDHIDELKAKKKTKSAKITVNGILFRNMIDLNTQVSALSSSTDFADCWPRTTQRRLVVQMELKVTRVRRRTTLRTRENRRKTWSSKVLRRSRRE